MESPTSAEKWNTREFLYYGLAAVLLLSIATIIIVLLWFTFPLMPPPAPGEVITLKADEIPVRGAAVRSPTGRFILSRTEDDALIALFAQAPNGCRLRWSPENYWIEEGCHGYRYRLDGTYIAGPRSDSGTLARYLITVVFTDGSMVQTNKVGDPSSLDGREIERVVVDLRELLKPENQAYPLGL